MPPLMRFPDRSLHPPSVRATWPAIGTLALGSTPAPLGGTLWAEHSTGGGAGAGVEGEAGGMRRSTAPVCHTALRPLLEVRCAHSWRRPLGRLEETGPV